jgi:hypothetical protein
MRIKFPVVLFFPFPFWVLISTTISGVYLCEYFYMCVTWLVLIMLAVYLVA